MDSGKGEWKCAKCGSGEHEKKHLNFRGSMGMTGLLDATEVTAYVCKGCGYIELYEGKR